MSLTDITTMATGFVTDNKAFALGVVALTVGLALPFALGKGAIRKVVGSIKSFGR